MKYFPEWIAKRFNKWREPAIVHRKAEHRGCGEAGGWGVAAWKMWLYINDSLSIFKNGFSSYWGPHLRQPSAGVRENIDTFFFSSDGSVLVRTCEKDNFFLPPESL